jgi:hypothetical protein
MATQFHAAALVPEASKFKLTDVPEEAVVLAFLTLTAEIAPAIWVEA